MPGFNQYFEQQANILIKKANNLRNRSQRKHAYHAAVLTIYGFQVAIPVLIGILAGAFLDKYYPVAHISWVLNFVLIGICIGFYNANAWFFRSVGLKKEKKSVKKKGAKK
ncbi:MAG: AtpZ/AtpI family protein [Alphaproteobacteria bacterium]|nr:AtpZ/AtpI family protein [Alphaproteobacteria bacterium]